MKNGDLRFSSDTFGIPTLTEVDGEGVRNVSAQGIIGLSEDVATYGDNNGQVQSVDLLPGEALVLADKHFGEK